MKKIFNSLKKAVKNSGIPDFIKKYKQDLKDIYQFYLDKQAREKLASMNPFKRFFLIVWWLLKSLFLKLSPIRRIIFILAVFFHQSTQNNQSNSSLGFLLILSILMLELKDKLLAKDELKAGRAVQKSLMPEPSPQFHDWDIWLFTRPANDVGGDLVDYIRINENKMGLTLADVSGKGLPAALFMSKIQSTLRALIPHCTSLPDLAQQMNKIFCRDCVPQYFATLVYLEIDRSPQIRYFNAGHLPPLILKDRKTEQVKERDPALGLAEHIEYHEHSFDLLPGETLFIYSDGITDAMDVSKNFFTEERFKEMLPNLEDKPSKEMGKEIIRQIDNFSKNQPQTDDMSLMIIKRPAIKK